MNDIPYTLLEKKKKFLESKRKRDYWRNRCTNGCCQPRTSPAATSLAFDSERSERLVRSEPK